MKVEQISIFLENKPGALTEATRILGEEGVNIRALSLADTKDFGILRLIVNDNEKARGIWGPRVHRKEDRSGGGGGSRSSRGLADILKIFSEGGINVEYLYAFVQQSGENAIIIFRFDETDRAIEVLSKKQLKILEGKKVYTL